MATETVSAAHFEIARSKNGAPILCADSDEAFRIGCAAEAVGAAVVLLGVLQREHRRYKAAYEFGIVFENTMARVTELLNSVNIGSLDDSIVESEEIANAVFGEDWLIGERRSDGLIVVAGAAA